MQYTVMAAAFSFLLLPGVFLVFIPLMPAMSYMFFMSALFGFLDHFKHLTLGELGILALIFLLSVLVDYLSGILGAKYGGASRKGIFYGFLGLLIGIIIFPPFGGFLGLFAGVLIAEVLAKRGRATALRAATGAVIGSFAGVSINVVLALGFLVSFVAFII